MEERPVVPEVLRAEELCASGGAVASRPLESRLRHEDVRMGRDQVPLLREDLPVLDKRQPLREGTRFPWEQSLLDDLPLVHKERAEPRRDEEHLPREPRDSLKGFRAGTCAL